MVDDGKITLTLGELKEYFKIWHENKFNDLHTTKVQEIISNYLNTHNITNKVNIIDNMKTSIINSINIMCALIDGDNSLTDSNTLENATTKLNNKYGNFKTKNYNSLTSISQALTRHEASISEKATIGYVKDQISGVNANLGVIPKQIQTQDIPVVDIGTDLNNYTTPGLYRSKDSTKTGILHNRPSEVIDGGFVLVVLENADNGVRQLLLTSEGSSIGNNIFTRNYVDSSWSDDGKWDKLYGSHNTQPLQMKIEWSDVPNTSTTYTLLQIRE